MKYSSVRLTVMLSVAGFLLSGCGNVRWRTQSDKELTGLFENNRERLLAAVRAIELRKTTRKDLEVQGFDFKAPNVDKSEGFNALNSLFKQEFRDLDPDRLDALIAKCNGYELVRIPCSNVASKSHRIYFSRKDTYTTGHETEVRILFHNNLVEYVEVNDVSRDKYQRTKAFARGFTELFSEFSGVAGGASKYVK